MDNTDIHYVDYDPETIWLGMAKAYVAAGGDVLYPGDEKEMTLRAVQSAIVQTLAAADTALRMATRRFAVGEYLDLYGDGKFCARIQAQAAVCAVEIRFGQTGTELSLPAGTAMTADGEKLYLLLADVVHSGAEETVIAQIAAQDAGAAGNGLAEGTQMQLVARNAAVKSIFTMMDASGGRDAEDDESYRERIGKNGLSTITTGPERQYEAAAMGVSTDILDARAMNTGPGCVGVYLIIADGADGDSLIQSVNAELTAEASRPLTDYVTVQAAEALPYTIKLKYQPEENADIADAVAKAVASYQAWQDETLGRAFNPDKLKATIYQCGALRVEFEEGSAFNGGALAYTAIEKQQRCKGSITWDVMGA